MAGYQPLTALGIALALAVVLDAAVPTELEGSGLLLGAVGIVLIAIASFGRLDPHDGLATWMATIFGALYVSLLSFVIRLGLAAPLIPAGSPLAGLGAERAWILLLILAVWSYDTGAYLVGKQFGRRKFLTHISPSKTYAGLVGGITATTIVVALGLWAVGQRRCTRSCWVRSSRSRRRRATWPSRSSSARPAPRIGTLIPGHGGMLDRIDSFLFAAPVVTLYVVAVFG